MALLLRPDATCAGVARPGCVAFVSLLVLLVAVPASAQSLRKDEKPASRGALRIEVTAGESGSPVADAAVMVSAAPEHRAAGTKPQLNVKTDARGVVEVPEIPAGKTLVQVIAKGFKSFSRWYEHAEAGQPIQIRLEKLPRWEDKPKAKR